MPEYFHACGYDGDLVRCLTMRARAEEDSHAVEAAVREFPDLFCNQSMVRTPELTEHKEKKGKQRGKTSSMFLDWNQIGEGESGEAWERSGKIFLDAGAAEKDALFAECEGVVHAKDRWQKGALTLSGKVLCE